MQAWAVIGLALAAVLVSSGYQRGIMRLMKSGRMIADPEGHLLTLANGNVWVARFSPRFTKSYNSSWGIGWQTKHVLLNHTKGEDDGIEP